MIYLIITRPHSKVNVNLKDIIYILRTTIPFKLEIKAFSYPENINSIIVFKD